MPRLIACAGCGTTVYAGTGSLGNGRTICRACRRKRRPPKPDPLPIATELRCPTCDTVFAPSRSTQVYCGPACRPGRNSAGGQKAGTASRGYGPEHQRERKKWAPGTTRWTGICAEPVCLEDDRRLDPTKRWDLAHDHVNGGYLGPAHPKCNRTEGGKRSGGSGWSRALTRVLSKACLTCGASFETIYPRQTYCAPSCRPGRGR